MEGGQEERGRRCGGVLASKDPLMLESPGREAKGIFLEEGRVTRELCGSCCQGAGWARCSDTWENRCTETFQVCSPSHPIPGRPLIQRAL